MRLNCLYHVEDHSASFLVQQNFCSKCAQSMLLFTLNLFHVTRNIHIVNRIYAYCADEFKSIRARKNTTTDLVRLIIHRDLAEFTSPSMMRGSLFSVPVIKSNYYRTSDCQMKKLRYINTQNIEPTLLLELVRSLSTLKSTVAQAVPFLTYNAQLETSLF
jgi:hypothetical protein